MRETADVNELCAYRQETQEIERGMDPKARGPVKKLIAGCGAPRPSRVPDSGYALALPCRIKSGPMREFDHNFRRRTGTPSFYFEFAAGLGFQNSGSASSHSLAGIPQYGRKKSHVPESISITKVPSIDRMKSGLKPASIVDNSVSLLSPERNSSEQSFAIRDNFGICSKLDRDLLGISSANV